MTYYALAKYHYRMKAHHNPSSLSLRKGMTLLEIVIVLGIIALIMAAGIGAFGGVMGGAQDNAALMEMQGLKAKLQAYKLSAGMYPSESQGLKALVNKPTSAPEPKRWRQQVQSIPTDPWNNEFVYKKPSTKGNSPFEIISKGEDGELGTDDDLSSEDEQ